MNDFISKPFDPELLYQKIVQKLPHTVFNHYDNSYPYEGQKTDQSYIQELSGGNKAFEDEMTRLFLEQVPKRSQWMNN